MNFFIFRRRKDHILLSPVPENISKSVSSEVSDSGFGGPHPFSTAGLAGPAHHSMDNVHVSKEYMYFLKNKMAIFVFE